MNNDSYIIQHKGASIQDVHENKIPSYIQIGERIYKVFGYGKIYSEKVDAKTKRNWKYDKTTYQVQCQACDVLLKKEYVKFNLDKLIGRQLTIFGFTKVDFYYE